MTVGGPGSNHASAHGTRQLCPGCMEAEREETSFSVTTLGEGFGHAHASLPIDVELHGTFLGVILFQQAGNR